MTRRASSTEWVVGTAVVCVLVLVASWLLLLGPLLDRAAATRAQAEEVRAQNEVLRASVEALRAEFGHLGEYENELAALQRGLPAQARLTDLTREIADAATDAGVTIIDMDVSTAVELSGLAATPLPTPEDATPETASTGDPAAPAPAAAPSTGTTTSTTAAPPVQGMVAIPLSVGVVGSVEPVRAFLAAVQTGLDRHLLVATLRVAALEASGAGERRPSTQLGDVEVTVGAYAYVLPGSDAGPAEESGPLPGGTGANPFAPSVEAPAVVPVDPAQSVADAVTDAIAEASEAAEVAATERAAAASAAAAAAAAARPVPVPADPGAGSPSEAGTGATPADATSGG